MGHAKTTDFGLAKNLKERPANIAVRLRSRHTELHGPEQGRRQGPRVGPLADVYALGAILYECSPGRPPFKGEGAWDTVKQVAHDDPLPPTRLRRGCREDLKPSGCAACTRSRPKRFPSALELANDLDRWL